MERPCLDPGFAQASELTGVSATSSRDAWAVGFASGGADHFSARTLTLHWNGARWTLVRSANRRNGGSYLAAVAGVSASDAWAVGYNLFGPAQSARSAPLIEHWNGRTWSIAKTSLPSASGLAGVAATAARQAWAVGFVHSENQLILTWTGTAWK